MGSLSLKLGMEKAKELDFLDDKGRNCENNINSNSEVLLGAIIHRPDAPKDDNIQRVLI